MKSSLRLCLGVCVVALVGLCVPVHAQERGDATAGENPPIIKHRINRHGADRVVGSAEKGFALTTGGTGNLSALTSHGGPVINTPVIYFIWYGNWNQSNGSDNPAGQQILRDFANSIGGSGYFHLNDNLTGSGGTAVSGNASFGGETTDAYSHGSRLSDTTIRTIVSSAISSHRLPFNASGVYFVLTSSDVTATSGFCTRYCGWHTAATTSGVGHYRYSFVGNANRCLNACSAQTTSPNGNAGVDAMVSIVAHEFEEATSDPDLNAWYDSSGNENADKCAWTFGHSQYQTSNGAWANVHLGGRDFLIQRNLRHNSTLGGSLGDKCQMDATHN